jgi:N,N-dimethylformamidase beta subunit-like, C-terminal
VSLTSVRGHQSDTQAAPWRGTRSRLLAAAAVGGAWLLARGPAARALSRRVLTTLRVANGGAPFHGDGPLLATLSPVRGRTAAQLAFGLERKAVVTLSILETGQGVASEKPSTVAETALREKTVRLPRGDHVLSWTPPVTLPARTYIARVSAQVEREPLQSMHVVVRVLGVDAAFAGRSAIPGAPVTLVVRTDARELTVQMLRSGPETAPTYANNEIKGIPVGDPLTVDWRKHANAPAPIPMTVGSDWATGIYAAQLTADDGRVGFAPLVVHPISPSSTRVAVVIPTSTWGAYNFYDADGDGWGDTWYARWHTMHVDLTRPHATRGVPYRYRSYDLAFQHWLSQTGKDVDMYSDEDIEAFAPDDLRAAYDLLVFPGHTEYVTEQLFDVVEGYRDRGGNLMFLSANNFFRRVDRTGHRLALIDEWRDLGRPESSLLGVQYVASDRGQRRGPFTVVGADVAPWAFAGTGLSNDSTFGKYGIEIDARSQWFSPSNTQVLATIPDLFGPGRSAEMTYYEHPSGARVFSAGVLDFGGQVLLWPQTQQILANVWQQLA